MARILILSLVFLPDNVSTAQIMGGLAAQLHEQGHELVVLSTTPHYNYDPEMEASQPLKNLWWKFLQVSKYQNIPIYHVWMPQKGTTDMILRLLSWIGFHIMSTLVGLVLLPRSDVIIAPSPPLTIGLSAWILSVLYKGVYIYNVQEIYPDCAVKLGVIRNKWLINSLLYLESFVYRKAQSITVIAPKMAQQLRIKGVPKSKIQVIPNFVDSSELLPLSKDNNFSRQYGIHNKFVISYAGNMGPAQNLEFVIKAAEQLCEYPDIHFMMIGAGMLRIQLEKQVQDLALSNLSFLPYQPYSLMPQIYAASDLCLVPLTPELGTEAIPSKVYRIMACERPVLAFAPLDSDLAHLVNSSKCGFVVSPFSSSGLVENILNAFQNQNKLCAMGRLGRKHIIEHYTQEIISGQYNDLVQSLS